MPKGIPKKELNIERNNPYADPWMNLGVAIVREAVSDLIASQKYPDRKTVYYHGARGLNVTVRRKEILNFFRTNQHHKFIETAVEGEYYIEQTEKIAESWRARRNGKQ